MSEFEWILGFDSIEIANWYEKTTEDETKFVIEALLAMAD